MSISFNRSKTNQFELLNEIEPNNDVVNDKKVKGHKEVTGPAFVTSANIVTTEWRPRVASRVVIAPSAPRAPSNKGNTFYEKYRNNPGWAVIQSDPFRVANSIITENNTGNKYGPPTTNFVQATSPVTEMNGAKAITAITNNYRRFQQQFVDDYGFDEYVNKYYIPYHDYNYFNRDPLTNKRLYSALRHEADEPYRAEFLPINAPNYSSR